jgi:hypothetical protein
MDGKNNFKGFDTYALELDSGNKYRGNKFALLPLYCAQLQGNGYLILSINC